MASTQVPEIIGRLKRLLGVKGDAALARALDLPQPTLANWKSRGSISVGAMARIATKVGRSIEWIATGREQTTQAIAALGQQAKRLQDGVLEVPFPAFDVTEQFLCYIKDAPPEERETILRLLRGLRASQEVRDHLVGQLKLIERLVEQEGRPCEGEADVPPSCAKAS